MFISLQEHCTVRYRHIAVIFLRKKTRMIPHSLVWVRDMGCRFWVQNLYHCNFCAVRNALLYCDFTVYVFSCMLDLFILIGHQCFEHVLHFASRQIEIHKKSKWTDRCHVLTLRYQTHFLKKGLHFCQINRNARVQICRLGLYPHIENFSYISTNRIWIYKIELHLIKTP